MRNKEDIFWGLLLVALAGYLVVSKMGLVVGISVGKLILTAIVGSWFISSLKKWEWTGICLSLSIIASMYQEYLGIEEIAPWPLVFAAFLLGLGMERLFKKKPAFQFNFNGQPAKANWKKGKGWEVYSIEGEKLYEGGHAVESGEQDDEFFNCSVSFGASSKYISGQNLSAAKIENAFGALNVYFENARLNEGKAMVSVDNAFGKTVLYIPQSWTAHVSISKGFGQVKEVGTSTGESGNVLFIKGDCGFGVVEIRYC